MTSIINMRTSDQIKAEINARFGFVPPFFDPAGETPQVLENLWQQTISAYIDNPLPALFKEKLSAYLSRYCTIPYCMVCHSCTLRPLGMTAQEVLKLLESSPPTEADINELLREIDLKLISEEVWPQPNSALEKYIFYCAIFIFLEGRQSEECQVQLRRLLTAEAYHHLVSFIAYVKTCHIWMLFHPEIAYEADKRVQNYLQDSLAEEPALADFFANYRERVRIERQSQAEQLAEIAERKRTEAVQRQSEERYRSLVEATSQVVWTSNAAGEFVNDVAGWSILTGRSEAALQGWGWLEDIHPEERELTAQIWRGAIATKSIFDAEFQIKTREGLYRYFSARAVPVREPDGCIREWVGTCTDITKRKLAEAALQKAYDELESLVEKRTAELLKANQFLKAEIAERQRAEADLQKEQEFLQVLLDNLQAGIVACDAQGILTLFNRATQEFHGLPEEPIPPQEWAQHYDLYQPDGKTLMKTEEIPLFRALQGEVIHNVEMAIVPRAANGSSGTARSLLASGQAIIDSNGNKQGAVVIMHDITERKRAEEERAQLIREQAARKEAEAARNELQRIFMQTPAAIQITRGPNHILEIVNTLSLQLVGKRELTGKPIREAFPELEGQGFFELIDRVYATGQAFIGNEMRVQFDRNNDGVLEESFWNFVYQPLFDANNQVYSIMTHAVEVTEQVLSRQEVEKKAKELSQLTEALKRTNQELDQFAYVTSHDLKAPLRGIANLSAWIEEDLAECLTEESREHLDLLRGRVHRLEALIDGILQYSRAGRVQAPTTVNVAKLLSEAIELLAPPPEVNIVVEPGMPILHTEWVPLQQVFMNLLNNAIKHGGKTDICIHIGVQEHKNYCEFFVTDNGIGIDPRYHQKIWEIFQRLEARDKVEGTGIGLSVIKKIIESRGGNVWLESEVGAGATFRFNWPKSGNEYLN
ncbi:MAG: PAS domain S-box protein [Aphanothece sp. CMT-3BRIN-NPC111]|jgi:PAS domain S-box-containing protein|nr:PAS domain S-box protein [Aphanothece sp. CMT-3BRIN-NPC111]